jgi:hypothetical protein
MNNYLPAAIILCFLVFIVYSLINLWRYNKLTKGQKIAWTIIIVLTAPSLAIGSIIWFLAKYLFYEHHEQGKPVS